MTEQIIKCGWHSCQNMPEPGSRYCAGHVALLARQAEEARTAAGMCCEPCRAAIRAALKLLRLKPGGMAAKIEAVLREVVP